MVAYTVKTVVAVVAPDPAYVAFVSPGANQSFPATCTANQCVADGDCVELDLPHYTCGTVNVDVAVTTSKCMKCVTDPDTLVETCTVPNSPAFCTVANQALDCGFGETCMPQGDQTLVNKYYLNGVAQAGTDADLNYQFNALGRGMHTLSVERVDGNGDPIGSPESRDAIQIKVVHECALDSECDDNNDCTIDICSGNECKYGPAGIGCCTSDKECAGDVGCVGAVAGAAPSMTITGTVKFTLDFLDYFYVAFKAPPTVVDFDGSPIVLPYQDAPIVITTLIDAFATAELVANGVTLPEATGKIRYDVLGNSDFYHIYMYFSDMNSADAAQQLFPAIPHHCPGCLADAGSFLVAHRYPEVVPEKVLHPLDPHGISLLHRNNRILISKRQDLLNQTLVTGQSNRVFIGRDEEISIGGILNLAQQGHGPSKLEVHLHPVFLPVLLRHRLCRLFHSRRAIDSDNLGGCAP